MLCVLMLMVPASAYSQPKAAFGVDCTEAPTPDMPGQGLSAFFQKTPDPLPTQEDPFARGASTTIYEQYGYSGLRFNTYDLGCGPDAARHPDAGGRYGVQQLVDEPASVADRDDLLDHRGGLRPDLP